MLHHWHHSTAGPGAGGECKPMKLYPGWIITDYGCSSSDCTTKVASGAKTLDACIKACVDTGFDECKSVQFKPAGSFGLKAAQCTMYDVQLEYMGAHATAQVLADGGLGAVAASYCEPPEGFTDFPDSERPDFGTTMPWAPQPPMALWHCAHALQ